MITRGGRRVMMTEQLPETPEFLRCKTITYAPTRILDGAKSLSYGANMLAGRLAREQGYDEAILVTPHGRVLEAPTSSLFWVEGETLLTPPLEDHILASITRAIILEVTDARERVVPAGSPAGRRRAVHRLHDPRGAGHHRGRRSDLRRPRPRHRADRSGGHGADRGRARRVKVLTVIGNRPQFIKAAAVSPRLREHHSEHLVHTGQHYDDRLSAIFFSELGLPAPDEQLGVGGRIGHVSDQPDARGAGTGARAYRSPTRCSSTGTPTRPWPARWPAPRRASRSCTSRRGCGRLTARCPRSSTGCSSTMPPRCCSAPGRWRWTTCAPSGWRGDASSSAT